MTHEALMAILADIKILDRRFIATPADSGGWFLQITYVEADVDTGHVEPQYSREWLIKPNATESDVVDTAFAAVMRSYDHVVQEHFTYKGRRVFSPHFTIEQRLHMCEAFEGANQARKVIEDKAAHSVAQGVTEVVIGTFEHALRLNAFNDVDALFPQLNLSLPPAALLGALSITFHAKDKLKNRDAFLARVEEKLRAELGDERTEDLLKHRR